MLSEEIESESGTLDGHTDPTKIRGYTAQPARFQPQPSGNHSHMNQLPVRP